MNPTLPAPVDHRRKLTVSTRVSLFIIGLIGIVFGIAYLPSGATRPLELPGGIELITSTIPLIVWSVLWLVAGAVSIVSALRPFVAGSAGVVGMLAVWGVAYGVAWIMHLANGQPARDYIGAVLYLGVSALLAIGSYVFNIALKQSHPPRRKSGQ